MKCYVCEQTFPESEIERHHVMYSPEYVVPVCKSCHNDIHADNGMLDHLDPYGDGPEWVASNHDSFE